ncbi:MAG: DUF2070 family protein [Thermofilaceae archaeon]
MGLEGFERGARMLFSFPKIQVLLPMIAALFAVALYIRCSIVYLIHVTALLPLLLKLSAPRLITAKRALGLTPFFIAWGILVTLLRGYSPLLITPPSLLISTATRFVSNKRSWPLLMLTLPLALILLEGGGTVAATIHIVLSTTILLLIEKFVRTLERELRDFGGLEVLMAYLNYALGGSTEQLAGLLTRISVEKRVPVYALDLLDDNGVWGIVVVSHVHPGPFRNFGSSLLPRLFIEEAQRAGIFCMVLHGASTHSEDLARGEDAITLVKRVLAGSGETLCTGSSLGVAERSNGTHRAVALSLEEGWSLVIVERVDGGMEDVPLSLMNAIGPKVILVDAHNSYEQVRPSPTLEHPLGASLLQCAASAVSSAREHVTSGWVIAAAQKPGHLGSELGGAGIAMLQLSSESGPNLLIVSFDANNMVRSVRDDLYDKLREPNTIVIFATTDTHELTGMKPGSTYDPLGAKQDADTYIRVINELAIDRMPRKPFRYRLRVFEFPSKYLDLDKLQRMSKVVETMLGRAMAIFTFCFATFFIPFILH